MKPKEITIDAIEKFLRDSGDNESWNILHKER